MKKQQKETEALQAQMDEEAKKKEEERAKQREKDLEKIADIEKNILRSPEDLTDTTNLLKVQRQRERGLAEIEALVLTEDEKRKAIAALNAFYDDKEAEAAAKDAEKETAAAQKKQSEKIKNLELEREFDAMSFEEQRQVLAERRQALLDDEILTETQKQELLGQFAEAEAQMDAKKVASKQAMLQAVANVAGAETKVGQALLIAKNILTMKEMIMDLKKITFKGKSAVAEAGVNAAQNVSESSKIGCSQNIITIAAAIGQGVPIIQQVKKAVGKTKAAGAGSATAPTVAATGGRGATEQQSPAFNIVGASQQSQVANAIAGANQRPVKAYVTSNDLTNGPGA